MKNYVYITPSGDGWQNLAIDEYLLDTLEEGALFLLLYVNHNAVILGKHQNPWLECNLEQMNADKVQLVRRCTGGGAVFHDKGNLNYSFIAHESRYDERRQTELILQTLRQFGIHAQHSGRNDLTVDGKKISGTAFCTRGKNRQHHGTLLVDADLDRLSDYLTVSPQKLAAKGVKSVRSRVCNLGELCPGITVSALSEQLHRAFQREYGEAALFVPDAAALHGIEALYARNRSWAWQLGKAPEFDYHYENRFDFGMVQLCINVKNGVISEVKLYTDSLDTELPARIEAALIGMKFDVQTIEGVLHDAGEC